MTTKAWIVITVLAAAVYWEYHNKLQKARGGDVVGRAKTTVRQIPRGRGVTASTGSGVRQATQLSSSGNSSPGSGSQAVQPQLQSTYAIGGFFGPGNVGPTYVPKHQSKTGKRA